DRRRAWLRNGASERGQLKIALSGTDALRDLLVGALLGGTEQAAAFALCEPPKVFHGLRPSQRWRNLTEDAARRLGPRRIDSALHPGQAPNVLADACTRRFDGRRRPRSLEKPGTGRAAFER